LSDFLVKISRTKTGVVDAVKPTRKISTQFLRLLVVHRCESLILGERFQPVEWGPGGTAPNLV